MNDYDEILVSLRKITRAIDLHSRRVLKTSGLTTSQLLVLQSIDRLGNPSPSAIAREVVLSQATVSSLFGSTVQPWVDFTRACGGRSKTDAGSVD